MKAVKEINVIGLNLRETPLVHPVYNRPYQMEANDSYGITKLVEAANASSGAVTTFDVSKASPDLVTLSTPTQESAIPNGYGIKRFAYVLTANIVFTDNSSSKVELEGFTADDHVVTPSGNINLNEVFYLSTVKTLYRTATPGAPARSDTSQVILPDMVRNGNAMNTNLSDPVHQSGSLLDSIGTTWKTQRPDDVYSGMLLDQDDSIWNEGPKRSVDTANSLGLNALTNGIGAGSSTSYTAGIINAYFGGRGDVSEQSDIEMGGLSTNLHSSCHTRCSSNALVTNQLLLGLSNVSDGVLNGMFTLADLMKIDRGFNSDRIEIFMLNQKTDVTDWTVRSLEDYNSDMASQMASTTNVSICNFMHRSGMLAASITISSRSIDESVPFVIDVKYPMSRQGYMVKTCKSSLMNMLSSELCPLLDAQFGSDFLITIRSDMMTENVVTVEADGNRPVTKTYSNYSSSVSSPILLPPNEETGIMAGMKRLVDCMDVDFYNDDQEVSYQPDYESSEYNVY